MPGRRAIVYGVRRGLFKLHYLDEQGNEWIKSFAQDGRFFASIAALAPGGRSSFMVTTLEPTVLEALPYDESLALALSDLGWARAVAALTMAFAARKEQRERDLLMLKAEQHYRLFCDQEPELVKRVPQKDLARLFGTMPVGLNRIVMRVRRDG